MARVRAKLLVGKSYTFHSGLTISAGTPKVLTRDEDIKQVKNNGFFSVTDLDAEDARRQAELAEATAKAEAEAEAGKAPKSAKSKGKSRRSRTKE